VCSRILVFCSKFYCNKCGGPPTMPEENRGPWSKKFENRWRKGRTVRKIHNFLVCDF